MKVLIMGVVRLLHYKAECLENQMAYFRIILAHLDQKLLTLFHLGHFIYLTHTVIKEPEHSFDFLDHFFPLYHILCNRF